MLFAIRITVMLVLLSSAYAGYHGTAKLRRDGVLNLYPFPRVGRSGPQSISRYQFPRNDLLLEYEPIAKRLISFPRVGRASIPALVRRAEQTPMWFGPRVGRSEHQLMGNAEQLNLLYGPRAGRTFKTYDEDVAIQNDPNNASEPEQVEQSREE